MSVRILYAFLLCWLYAGNSFSQHSILSANISTSSRGMAGAGLCSPLPESGIMNPALVSNINKIGMGLFAHNYFLLEELYHFSVEGHYPLNSNNAFGLLLAYDGSSAFNENLIGIQYGRKLSKFSTIGLQLNYLVRNALESKSSSHVGFDLGFQTKITEHIFFGALAKNPIPMSTPANTAFPSLYKIGVLYRVNTKFNILLEAHKTIQQALQIVLGLEYKPLDAITLRTGFDAGLSLWAFGISFEKIQSIQFDLSSTYHTQLGFSPSAALRFLIK